MDFRRNGGKYLVVFEVMVLILVVVFGAIRFIIPGSSHNNSKIGNNTAGSTEYVWNPSTEAMLQQSTDGTGDEQGDAAAGETISIDETIVPAEFSEAVEQKIESMSVEQKVCQLFITRPEEVTGVAQFTQAGKKTQESLAKYPLGGYVFGADNFNGVTATRNIMANINKYVSAQGTIPMFLAVNEAGGNASPLAVGNKYEVQPSISDIKSADEASQSAGKISVYMNESLLNMNLGLSAQTNGDFVAAQVKAYDDAGIYTSAGTFPGENVSDIKSAEEQYKKVAASDVSVLMIGNYQCMNLTGNDSMPCSTSTRTAAYVRNTLGYSGVLMTADLSAGLSGGIKADKAAVEAVKSGIDMVYVSNGFADCYNAVLDAVNKGEISQDRLNQAVGRIITCKIGE